MEFKGDNLGMSVLSLVRLFICLGLGIKAHEADRFQKQQQEFSDTLQAIGNLFGMSVPCLLE